MSWWMTGKQEALFFLVLFKASVHGQVRLQKMAGDLLEPTWQSVRCLMLTAAISIFQHIEPRVCLGRPCSGLGGSHAGLVLIHEPASYLLHAASPFHPFSVISLAGGQLLGRVHAGARPERTPADRSVVGPAQGGQGALREEGRRHQQGHTISNVACARAALRSAVAAGAYWCRSFWCSGVSRVGRFHTLHGARPCT